MAQLKLKQLEEKHLVMDEEYKLETEMHERKLNTELARLKRKKEVIDAQTEVKKCALESQSSVDDEAELEQRSECSLGFQQNTLQQKIERFFNSDPSVEPGNKARQFRGPPSNVDEHKFKEYTGENIKINPRNSTNNPSVPNPVNRQFTEPPKYIDDRYTQEVWEQARGESSYPERCELHQLLERQTQLMERQQETVHRFTTGMELPKREFLYFDGNPTNYPRFMRNFELNMENRVLDPSVKLSFLTQYTIGTAREVIENCVILPAEEGYNKAKEILRKNFGQKHTIVRAFIAKVTAGQQINPGEADKLMQLSRDMRNCLLNSTQMNYKADINSMDTLTKIVKRLPSYLQAKWAECSGKLIKRDVEPEFLHLVEFVEWNAAIANTTFGKLVGSKPDEDTKQKPKPRFSNRATSFATKQMETETNEFNATKSVNRNFGLTPIRKVVSCTFCNSDTHEIGKCFKFRDKPHKERMDFVREERLCYNCLRRNYVARRCRFNAACMISDCGRKHHSLLHTPSSENLSPDLRNDKSLEHVNEAGNYGNCSATAKGKHKVSLRIVPVKVSNQDGTRELETYAFIDNGSDTTLCTKSLAEELNLPSKPAAFTLTTINGQDKLRSGQEVKLNIQSLNGDGEIQVNRVGTVEELPITEKSIPTVEETNRWQHLEHIQFPHLENGKVTILIVSDVPEAHWVFEERRGRPKEPLATRTLLGWTLLGPVRSDYQSKGNVNFIH